MSVFFDKIRSQFDQKLPFVSYCKPNENKIIGIFQKTDDLFLVNDFKENGFVFAPFDGNKIVLIPENQSEIKIKELKLDDKKSNVSLIINEDLPSKFYFEHLVQKGIETINEGSFSKVVLSRKEEINLPDFDLIVVFENLLNEYPTAFVYCFYHSKVGLWFGAFSEQLLKVAGKNFKTMAVAGSQLFIEKTTTLWGNKEKKEQEIVTDFIIESLKKETKSILISEPYTLKAGKMAHLKTDISGELNSDASIEKILQILHPTPAVCGLPKNKAKEFILSNEGYDREYYSGFFGELNKNFTTSESETNLYVNLRCTQIKNKLAILYLGCGITKDSIPENEWIETVNKSMTIKKCLL